MSFLRKIQKRFSGAGYQKVGHTDERQPVLVSRGIFNTVGAEFFTESKVDIGNLVGKGTDIGDVESSAVDQILWAAAEGHFATWVAISRFLAKYAQDPVFREEFKNNPEKYQVTLIQYLVEGKDLYVYDELGDRKVHPYPYESSEGMASYLIQEGTIAGATPLEPESVRLNLDFLSSTDADTILRVIEILYTNDKAGYRKLEGRIFKYDEEGTPINLLEAIQIVNNFSHVDEKYRQDILGRRILTHLVGLGDVSKLQYISDDKEGYLYEAAAKKVFQSNEGVFPILRETVVEEVTADINTEIKSETTREFTDSEATSKFFR